MLNTKKILSTILPVAAAIGTLGFMGSAQAVTLTGTFPGESEFTLSGDFQITAIDPKPLELLSPNPAFNPLQPITATNLPYTINSSATGGSIIDFAPTDGIIDIVDGSEYGVGVFGSSSTTLGEFSPWASPGTINKIYAQMLDIAILPGGQLVLPSDTNTVVSEITGMITADASATVPGVPITNVGWTFNLEEVDSAPLFSQVGDDVILTVGFAGSFYDENGLKVLDGSGNLTSQWESNNVVSLLASLVGLGAGNDGLFGTSDDVAINPVSLDNSWSADFTARSAIPESDTKVGLAVALGLGLISIKKGKKFLA